MLLEIFLGYVPSKCTGQVALKCQSVWRIGESRVLCWSIAETKSYEYQFREFWNVFVRLWGNLYLRKKGRKKKKGAHTWYARESRIFQVKNCAVFRGCVDIPRGNFFANFRNFETLPRIVSFLDSEIYIISTLQTED